MDYDSALSRLRRLERLGYRFRLENTRDLLDELGYSYDGETVHIAGTNGKGSCAIALARILEEAGERVGLYTSPELIDFTERIRVDREQIGEGRFAKLAQEVMERIESMKEPPTFFEATTALALKYFEDAGVSVMVLEAGMGGRLDSTNAVSSTKQVITNVELDHTRYLGETIGEIATEKAGIIHEGSLVVSAAEGQGLQVVAEACKKRGAKLVRFGDEVRAKDVLSGIDGTSFTLETKKKEYALQSGMRGAFQAKNIACAIVVAEALGAEADHIASGVSKAYWPGRLDLVQPAPRVILDCAHNPSGMRNTMDYVSHLEQERLHVVAGFMADKDYKGMVAHLSGADSFTATRADNERALEPEKILELVEGNPVHDVDEAVDSAMDSAGPSDLVLVSGSILLAGQAIRRWRKRIDL